MIRGLLWPLLASGANCWETLRSPSFSEKSTAMSNGVACRFSFLLLTVPKADEWELVDIGFAEAIVRSERNAGLYQDLTDFRDNFHLE